jgi:geranylgeranylglycerol-phosphate geranylgeranyltransferase
MDESRVYTDEDAYALKRRRLPADDPFSEMRQKLTAFWVLARFPWRLQFALLGVLYMMVFGRVVYNAPLYSIPLLIAAFAIVALINAGGCAINDYFDREADAISKPYRPIPAGTISPAGALEYTAVTFVIGVALALYINLLAFAVVVLAIILLVLYSPVFKQATGFFSNALIAFVSSLVAVFGEAILLGQISYFSLSFIPSFVAGGMAFNALKDIQTVEGDAKAGYTTLAVTRGVHAAIIAAALITILSGVLSYLPFILGVVGAAYAIVVTFQLALMVILVQSLLRKPDLANVRKQQNTFGVSFVLTLISLLAGAFL